MAEMTERLQPLQARDINVVVNSTIMIAADGRLPVATKPLQIHVLASVTAAAWL